MRTKMQWLLHYFYSRSSELLACLQCMSVPHWRTSCLNSNDDFVQAPTACDSVSIWIAFYDNLSASSSTSASSGSTSSAILRQELADRAWHFSCMGDRTTQTGTHTGTSDPCILKLFWEERGRFAASASRWKDLDAIIYGLAFHLESTRLPSPRLICEISKTMMVWRKHRLHMVRTPIDGLMTRI